MDSRPIGAKGTRIIHNFLGPVAAPVGSGPLGEGNDVSPPGTLLSGNYSILQNLNHTVFYKVHDSALVPYEIPSL